MRRGASRVYADDETHQEVMPSDLVMTTIMCVGETRERTRGRDGLSSEARIASGKQHRCKTAGARPFNGCKTVAFQRVQDPDLSMGARPWRID